MESHWDTLPTIRVVDAGYLLAGLEPVRKWQFAPPLVANFFNLIHDRTGAVKLATMPGERMTITQAEFQALKAAFSITPIEEPTTVPAQNTATPAPVATEKTSNNAESTQDNSTGPLALTTGDIAFCFDGLRWSEQKWKKPLGNKPKWLQACVHTPGQRGVFETRWNPVAIGAALVKDGHTRAKSVRARFQTKDLLKPWLDAWKTYEADNLTTD